MRNFIQELHVDVRAGQQSWRVFFASSLVGLAGATANIVIGMIR